jgi:pimeloyl-CoA synthetase
MLGLSSFYLVNAELCVSDDLAKIVDFVALEACTAGILDYVAAPELKAVLHDELDGFDRKFVIMCRI